MKKFLAKISNIRFRLYFPKLTIKISKRKITHALIILIGFCVLTYYKTPELKNLFKPKVIKLAEIPKTAEDVKILVPENLLKSGVISDTTAADFTDTAKQEYTDVSTLQMTTVDPSIPPRVAEKMSADLTMQMTFYNSGMQKYFSRIWRAAIEDFLKVIESSDLKSDFTSQSYLKIADAYFQLEDYNNCLKFYQYFLQVFGENYERIASVYHNMAVAYFSAGKYDASKKYFELAIAKSPTSVESYIGLANYYLNFTQNYKAIEIYRKALNIHPKNVTLNFNLGYLLFHLNQNRVNNSEIVRLFDNVINNATTGIPTEERLRSRAAFYNYLIYKESSDYQNAYNYLVKTDNSIYKNRELATLYFLLNRPIEEIEALYRENIFIEEPNNIENYLRLADKLYNSGIYDKAMGYYARALKINSNSVAAYFGFGRCAVAQKMYDIAYNAFARLEKKIGIKNEALVDLMYIPDDKTKINVILRDAYHYLGYLSAQKSKYDQSIKCYKNAILLTNPSDTARIAELSHDIASVYHYNIKDYQSAEKYYQTAANYKTESRKYERALGNFYFTIGNYSNAIDYIGKYPRSIDEKYMIAYSYYKLGDYPRSIELFENIIQSAADNPSILNAAYKTLGNISFFKYTKSLQDKKELEKAADYFNNAIKFNEKDDISYFNAGLCFFQLEDYNKAINYIKSAIELNPKVSKYYSGLANCYYAKKLFDLAEQNYRRAIVLDSSNIEAQYNLMRLQEQRNE